MSIVRLLQCPLQAVLLCLYFFVSSSLSALQPVEVVGSVDFEINQSPYDWNAIFIDLRANENPSETPYNKQFVDDVKVILTTAYKMRQGPDKFTYYQAEVTLATLERGKTKRVSFFLPEDIVERDQLDNEPEYWTIDIEIGGRSLKATPKRLSRSIKDLEMLEKFRRAYSSKVQATDGILVPAHRSPYGYGFGEREPAPVVWKSAK